MAHIDTPTVFQSNGTLTSEGTLAKIEEQSRAIEIESRTVLNEADTAERASNARAYEAGSGGGSSAAGLGAGGGNNEYAQVYGDLAVSALGGDVAKFVKDGLSFLEDRMGGGVDLAGISKQNPLISGTASTFESLFDSARGAKPLERIDLASKSLSANSSPRHGGDGDGVKLGGMETPAEKLTPGVHQVRQLQYSQRLASEAHLQQVQAVRMEQGPYRSRMQQAMPQLGLGSYSPKPPTLAQLEEDNQHSWSGLGGSA